MGVKRRRLSDLYKRGKELTIDDGQGGITVWVQKLNPVDHSTALRKANAAQARVLMYRNNFESDEYADAYTKACDIGGHDELVDFLAAEDIVKKAQAIEAELAAEDEWAKDDFLQGLRDAWEGGLADEHAAHPDDTDPEGADARACLAEMARFAEQVDERIKEYEQLAKDGLMPLDEETLRQKAAVRLLEMAAGTAWFREYQRCQIWLATRLDTDHTAYYFTDREEVDACETEVLSRIANLLEALTVEVTEGKGLEETPASSPLSEPQAEEAGEKPSGRLAAVL